MTIGEAIRIALAEIWHHKTRSILTLVGILLGTLAITVMTSLMDGVFKTVNSGIDSLGFDGVAFVVAQGPKDHREAERFAHSKGLMPEDGRVLLARAELVQSVAPVTMERELVRRGSVERDVQITGVTPEFATVRNRALAAGRFINAADERTYSRVVVLGHLLAQRLFGAEDPLGKTISIGGRQFTVVGRCAPIGNKMIRDHEAIREMEGAMVPLATLRKLVLGEDQPVAYLAAKTDNLKRLSDLKAELEAGMKVAHRGASDFKVENIAEEIVRARVQIEKELTNWRIVLGSISGISLLVGGIGLLSVMLISIGERMFEIGLRKASGANNGQIFVQFLAESMVLSTIGGLLGAGAGAAIALIAASQFPSGLDVNLVGLTGSLGISLVLGGLYGLYPAFRAARMTPAEALRAVI